MLNPAMLQQVNSSLVNDVVTTLPNKKAAIRLVQKGTDLNHTESNQLVSYIKNYLATYTPTKE